MAVRRIIRMGHPHLREPARQVELNEIHTPDFKRLLEDMHDTLHDYGGIGLAAPQIDVALRLAIVEIAGGATRYGVVEPLPLTAFINPEITVLDEATAGHWEGCLSVPGLRGYVERPQHIRVDYIDLQGESQSLELTGFWATVAQHEFDHLDGRLYIDRISEPDKLMFEEEFARYHAPAD